MLAILSTHPIQYQVPLWQALARDGAVPFEVWYLTKHGTRPSFDQQFGKTFAWDLDTLAGYPHRFIQPDHDLGVSGFSQTRLAVPLRKMCQERGATALWVQGWQVAAYWQAVWQARGAGISVWLRGESNDLAPQPPVWKKLGKRFLLGEFFRRVSQFLYIGRANRRLYENFGVPETNLHPAPYCVDNARFVEQSNTLRAQRVSIRRSWNIPDDAFCVLFAGKFIPKKRPLDLIAAARRSDLGGRAIHLLFAGSGELGPDLRRACHVVFDADPLAAGRGRGDSPAADAPRASFVGFLNQTEISKAYVAADCLVLPSDHGETWGLVVNEAMASGLPCIVSDACGCSEDLVAPLNERFRFPLGDVEALSAALREMAAHPCPAHILQSQVGKFTVSATVETVKCLYSGA